MIQQGTLLEVADNSGAREVLCIKVLGGAGRRYAQVGDKIKVSIRKTLPQQSKVERKSVQLCVVVRTKSKMQRKDGSVIRFDTNAVVLINKQGEPIGTRIFGPVPDELRKRKYTKILSLAPEVI